MAGESGELGFCFFHRRLGFRKEAAEEKVKAHFGVESLKGFEWKVCPWPYKPWVPCSLPGVQQVCTIRPPVYPAAH